MSSNKKRLSRAGCQWLRVVQTGLIPSATKGLRMSTSASQNPSGQTRDEEY